MKIIISASVEFNTPEDVLDYEALDISEIPEDDVPPILNAVNYKVGYKHIVIEVGTGNVVFLRKDAKGMAVDGQPIILRGDGFRRINCD